MEWYLKIGKKFKKKLFARKGHDLLEKNATIQVFMKILFFTDNIPFCKARFLVAKGNGFVYGQKQPPKSCFCLINRQLRDTTEPKYNFNFLSKMRVAQHG